MEKLKFASCLKKGDFRKISYWNMFGRGKGALIALIVFLAAGIAVLAFAKGRLEMLVIGVMLAAAPVILILGMEISIGKAEKGDRLEKGTSAEYELGEQGISMENIYTREKLFYDWVSIERIYMLKDYCLLFINAVQMITVRYQDLSDSDRILMEEYFDRYVGKNRIIRK